MEGFITTKLIAQEVPRHIKEGPCSGSIILLGYRKDVNMVEKESEVCGNCKFWRDYNDRVYANISRTKGNTGRGTIELRVCKYNPPPTISQSSWVHTDEDYTCSGFIR